MNRRGFLGTILALGVAPAIVKASSLARIFPSERRGIFKGELGRWDGVRFISPGPGMLAIYAGEGGPALAVMPIQFEPLRAGVLRGIPTHGDIIRTGTASWYRLINDHGDVWAQGTVGPCEEDSLSMSNTHLVTAQQLNVHNIRLGPSMQKATPSDGEDGLIDYPDDYD